MYRACTTVQCTCTVNFRRQQSSPTAGVGKVGFLLQYGGTFFVYREAVTHKAAVMTSCPSLGMPSGTYSGIVDRLAKQHDTLDK